VVAQVNEQNTAVVADGFDPTGQRDVLTDMLRAELVTSMSSKHSFHPPKQIYEYLF